MHIKAEDTRYCLDKASEMDELYRTYCRGDGSGFPRSMRELLWLCEHNLKLKVDCHMLDMPPVDGSVRGVFMATDLGYEIYLVPDPKPFWNRFVLCKELFQVLLDGEEYRSMDIYGLIKEVAQSFPVLHSHPGPATVSEVLAEIAATEFLFPYKERLLQLDTKRGVNYKGISDHYRIPQFYVEKYLLEPMMKYIGAFISHGT